MATPIGFLPGSISLAIANLYTLALVPKWWIPVREGVGEFATWLWGPPLVIVLLPAGAYFTLRLFFPQIRHFWHAVMCITGRYDRAEDPGALTHFRALSTALSATIGTGNIVGVATAIASGGPGAVFWMWVSGFFGMATKFYTCTLASKFRHIDPDGHIRGGPMYYIKLGLGNRWAWLGWVFALATAITALGIGNMVQSNAIADQFKEMFRMPTWLTGLILAVLVFMVIIGGVKRIGAVAGRVVPFMAVIYLVGGLVVVFANLDRVGPAFSDIFRYAFTPYAPLGAGLGIAMRYGLARGVFSNEAGLGSAPMAHAAARTTEPIREGFVAMLGPFIDTLVICTVTALTIVMTGANLFTDAAGRTLDGAPLTSKAFELGVPFGAYIVTFALLFFAFTTMLGWSYYGEQGFQYIFGRGVIQIYRYLWVAVVIVGAVFGLKLIWAIADIFNALMLVPTLIGTLLLSGVVAKMYHDYIRRMRDKFAETAD